MTRQEFTDLAALSDQKVQLTFKDGESFVARLLSVSIDLDGTQHLIYDDVEKVSRLREHICYSAGEELVSCLSVE